MYHKELILQLWQYIIYTDVSVRVCSCECTCVGARVCVRVLVHMCMYVCACACDQLHTYVYKYAYILSHIYFCIHIYIYISIYIYTYIYFLSIWPSVLFHKRCDVNFTASEVIAAGVLTYEGSTARKHDVVQATRPSADTPDKAATFIHMSGSKTTEEKFTFAFDAAAAITLGTPWLSAGDWGARRGCVMLDQPLLYKFEWDEGFCARQWRSATIWRTRTLQFELQSSRPPFCFLQRNISFQNTSR